MDRRRIKAIWERLLDSGAAKVARRLAGPQAQQELLAQTGYAGRPAGLAGRLALELGRGLPLACGPEQIRRFGQHFPGPETLAQTRAEAALPCPLTSRWAQTPSSRVRLSPEEAADLWPWTSGQRQARLARAWAVSGDGELLRACQRGWEAFLAASPPLMGPGWTEAELVAVRALNWLVALRFLIGGGPLPAGLALELTAQMRVMGLVLAEAAAAGPAASAAGPAAALLFLAQALSFLPEAGQWQQTAQAKLGPALAAWSDSTAVLDAAAAVRACQWGALALWLGGKTRLELPGAAQALVPLARLCRAAAPPWGPGGEHLAWGGEPARALLDLDRPPVDPFTAAANLAALVLEDPDLRAGRHLDQTAYWLLGPPAAAALRDLAGGTPPRAGELAGAGLAWFCAASRGRRVAVWLRTAPQPAQALAVSICLDGRSLIVPPGPAASGPLAGHLASRAAASTLCLDQSEPEAAAVELEGLEVTGGHAFLAASHQGYRGGQGPIRLRRRVYLDVRAGVVNLVDQIAGQGEHLCEVFLHFPPRVELEPRDEEAWLARGPWGEVLIRPEPKAQAGVITGRSSPPLGWRAVAPGRVESAPSLRVWAAVVGRARLTTAFILTVA